MPEVPLARAWAFELDPLEHCMWGAIGSSEGITALTLVPSVLPGGCAAHLFVQVNVQLTYPAKVMGVN